MVVDFVQHPYTVSAVVDTASGELVGPPQVCAGHKDYAECIMAAAEPAHTTQFRWVHVYASDKDAAAAAAVTGALTADLRPGGDRSAPQARALHGETGLKKYTVIGVVNRFTGRLSADPQAVPGEHGGVFYGQFWHQCLLVPVWARDAAAAIEEAFGPVRRRRRRLGGSR